MKQMLLLVSVLFSGISIIAQPLTGTYKNGSDSLVFNGNKVTFRVSGFGGLSSAQAGMGNYERVNNFLLIHTLDYPGDKSTFQKLDSSRNDTCVIKVVDLSNYPIQGVLIEPDNTTAKLPGGRITGSDGKIYLTHTQKTRKITVSGMGINTVTIDYSPCSDYLVKVADNEVVEDQTVVFMIREVDDETLSLLLLTDNFDSRKKRDSELHKLERKVRKSHRMDKRFKKEYEPYVRSTQADQ